MYELAETDYEILRYIGKHGPVSISDVIAAFPRNPIVEYRINQMDPKEYMSAIQPRFRAETVHYLKRKDEKYELTEIGWKAVQDYSSSQRRARRDLWMRTAWIPILVSVVTTLAMLVIKYLLIDWLPVM